jgi:hypothetical protein
MLIGEALMVQNGIAYAAGQLLAVVAPRTVLVVDAPTDWSLAGPLWELALDDAPVDEILDVLIRRGIRTSPSFAIVRVETDAVRALVRGSVPVCFERVGEPVRLDATGATTWLEGLISGARRVLVGDVEANTSLPFLVSTGVVLVSGLALPTGPVEPERRQLSSSPAATEPESKTPPESPESAFSFNSPVPVSSGGGPFAPVAGREPRVVDLTRSEPRSPARAQSSATPEAPSRAFPPNRNVPDRSSEPASRSDLNGHTPSVLDSPSSLESGSVPDQDVPLFGSPVPEAPAEAPANYGQPFAFQSSPPPFEPPAPSEAFNDDPGELLDLDSPVSASAATAPPAPDPAPAPIESYRPSSDFRPTTGSFESRPLADPQPYAEPDSGRNGISGYSPDRFGNRDSANGRPTDDLLGSSDDDRSAGPSSTGMPRLAPPPPSLSIPLPSAMNGSRALPPAIDRTPDNVPPAWPAAPELPGSNDASGEFPSAWSQPSAPSEDGNSSGFARPGAEPPSRELAPRSYENPANSQPVNRNTDGDQPQLAELPLRVRGRSLRPEQSEPLNGRAKGAQAPDPQDQPEFPTRNAPPPLRVLGEGRFRNASESENPQLAPPMTSRSAEPDSGPNADNDSNGLSASGSLALPAFFRGSKGPRKPGSSDESASNGVPAPLELESGPLVTGSGPDRAPTGASSSDSPAVAWAPPVRRTFPERPGLNGGPPSEFNGSPPSMPGVLRPVNSHNNSSARNPADDEYVEASTEFAPAPGYDHDQASDQREPARLLGVWCDAGHVTSPDRAECRVCGLAVPPQAPILVARPPLGVLIFDNGDRVEVDRPVVLGRDPKPIQSADPEAPILHAVNSSTGQVSRTHAEIRANDWDVVLTDLGAMNGTALTLPGESPVAIEPGVATVITPGARVDLGGESGFVFEIEG